jgi:hypothetical protein
MSVCGLRASKRFESVWTSFRRTQALNDHVRAILLPSQPFGSSNLDEADSVSLAASIELSEKSCSWAVFCLQSVQDREFKPDRDICLQEVAF